MPGIERRRRRHDTADAREYLGDQWRELKGALGRNDSLRGFQKQRVAQQRAQAAKPMADGRRRKMEPLRRPADVPLRKDDLEQHEQVEIDPRKISLIHHYAEIISLDSS